MATPKLRFKEFDTSWERKSFGDITSKIGSGSTPRGGSKAYTEEGVVFIRSQNVNNNQLILENIVYIPQETHVKMSGSKVVANDILLNITGASIGRSCVVPSDFKEGNVNQHVCIIRSQNHNPLFIQSFLSSKKGQNAIQSRQTGSGREGINFQAVRSIDLNLPPLKEQTKIATFLSAVDTKIDELTQKHELLSEYKKGMMQQLFSQKLRFKGFSASWNDIKVGSLGTFNSGGTPSKKNSAYWKGDIPWISSSDLTEDSIFEVMTTRYITREAIDNSATKIIPKNSVLIVSRVGVGKVAVNSSQLCTSQDFTSLTPFEDNPVFLAYLLKSKVSRLLEFNQGTSIKGFVRDDLINLSVSIPTKEEQTKIADFLTTIDQKIDNVAEQIDHAKTWKKGLLQQMFV